MRPSFLVLLAVLASGCFRGDKTYVFINETSDHRFDESIRMSIYAAYRRSGVQNAVVISDRERDAEKLFQKLKIGLTTRGRGILYLFSPRERRLQIEVGYALEGVLPDVRVKMLELAAKSFIYSDRYQDFWAELINTMNIDVQQGGGADEFPVPLKFLSGGAGITSNSYDKSFDQFKLESPGSVDVLKFRAGADIRESYDRYLQSLAQGVGDVGLDLLTDEARFRRNLIPLTNFQLFRNHRMLMAAGIDTILESGNLAFIFPRGGHPVLPVILRKEGAKWRVHEALAWSLFQRFEDSSQVFLKFPLRDAAPALMTYIQRVFGNPIYRGPEFSLPELGSPLVAGASAEMVTLKLAWPDYIVSKYASSDEEEKLWILADAYQSLGQFTRFVDTYLKLSQKRPNDSTVKRNFEFYQKHALFNDDEWRLSLE